MLSKHAYHSVSDGHLWFSIFSRPPSNKFTRVQRCTCCFVLLFVSMFLNIMYYDLSDEANMTNSTNTVSLSFGSLYITPQQVGCSFVRFFLIQIFRRLGSRKREIAPLREALYKIKPSLNMFVEFQNEIFILIFCLFSPNDVDEKKNKVKSSFTFPWWCIFIAYGLCIILVGLSIIFIIARGIEFGDSKTQKWLTSVLSGFFSSILLTQPLKVKGCFEFFHLSLMCFVLL
jgi:polycystin 1L2